jgi:hypothetical protein
MMNNQSKQESNGAIAEDRVADLQLFLCSVNGAFNGTTLYYDKKRALIGVGLMLF